MSGDDRELIESLSTGKPDAPELNLLSVSTSGASDAPASHSRNRPHAGEMTDGGGVRNIVANNVLEIGPIPILSAETARKNPDEKRPGAKSEPLSVDKRLSAADAKDGAAGARPEPREELFKKLDKAIRNLDHDDDYQVREAGERVLIESLKTKPRESLSLAIEALARTNPPPSREVVRRINHALSASGVLNSLDAIDNRNLMLNRYEQIAAGGDTFAFVKAHGEDLCGSLPASGLNKEQRHGFNVVRDALMDAMLRGNVSAGDLGRSEIVRRWQNADSLMADFPRRLAPFQMEYAQMLMPNGFAKPGPIPQDENRARQLIMQAIKNDPKVAGEPGDARLIDMGAKLALDKDPEFVRLLSDINPKHVRSTVREMTAFRAVLQGSKKPNK